MNYEKNAEKIKQMQIEKFMWIIFLILILLNIYGDDDIIKYLKTNDNAYKTESDDVFLFTLVVTFFIYCYFFNRNYKAYKEASESQKQLYSIKLLGSSFLIAGIICLIYFLYILLHILDQM